MHSLEEHKNSLLEQFFIKILSTHLNLSGNNRRFGLQEHSTTPLISKLHISSQPPFNIEKHGFLKP